MIALIVGMLICVGMAVAVVGLVAVPARREGRGVLTPKGEEVVARVKERTETTVEAAGDLIGSTRDKVADATSRDTSGDDTSGDAAGRDATSRGNTSGDATVRDDVLGDDTSRRDTSRGDTSRGDTSRGDTEQPQARAS